MTNEENQEKVENGTTSQEDTISDVELEVTSDLEQLQNELSEMEDKFLRARAEIANMSNRFKNERELLTRYRSQDLAKRILPAIDNLERAMKAEVEVEQGANLKKGIEMVLENLKTALKEEGIEEIAALGESFDPNLHQAVQTITADEKTPVDTIVDVLQTGYKLHDRILRPSMVIVAQ